MTALPPLRGAQDNAVFAAASQHLQEQQGVVLQAHGRAEHLHGRCSEALAFVRARHWYDVHNLKKHRDRVRTRGCTYYI